MPVRVFSFPLTLSDLMHTHHTGQAEASHTFCGPSCVFLTPCRGLRDRGTHSHAREHTHTHFNHKPTRAHTCAPSPLTCSFTVAFYQAITDDNYLRIGEFKIVIYPLLFYMIPGSRMNGVRGFMILGRAWETNNIPLGTPRMGRLSNAFSNRYRWIHYMILELVPDLLVIINVANYVRWAALEQRLSCFDSHHSVTNVGPDSGTYTKNE